MDSRAFYAEESEKSALGAMMRSERAARDIRFLDDSDFYFLHNRRIYQAMTMLMAQKRPIDLTTVSEQLTRMGSLESAGGAEYLVELLESTPSAANARAYATAVREAALMRRLRDIGEALTQDAANPMNSLTEIIDKARGKLRELVTPGDAWVTLQTSMLDAFEYLERVAAGKIRSIKTGIQTLDAATGGIFDGELTVIGARPSVGKSALGLQIALECGRQGRAACLASLEMTGQQLAQRVLSSGGKVDGMRMRTGALTTYDWEQMANAMTMYSEARMSILSGVRYVEDLRMEVQKKIDLGECDLLVVDYLQLLDTKTRTRGDTERVGACSRAMKALTLEFGIPVVALAQVNRNSEAGGKSAPSMSELRSSGEIEQDADTVILLHRPEDVNDKGVLNTHIELFLQLEREGKQYIVAHIAKQRQGQVGRVRFAFDPAHMRYERIPE